MTAVAKVLNFSPRDENIKKILEHANSIILDKNKEIQLSISCLLAGGHLLIEDRPGMGKTILVKTLAKLFGLKSQRIQFTNDILPADIVGTSIFNSESRKFEFHPGPIFANFVLADEINRATPKTQSACLQAMEEYHVSVDGVSHPLPQPFFLVATQNPQENIGTFPLPESQVDRFLMRIELGLPSRQAEREILKGIDRNKMVEELPEILNADSLKEVIETVKQVHSSEGVLDYLQDIIEKSRTLGRGLSPRGARDLHQVAKAWAFIQGRDYVIPEDVQSVAVSVMNHRMASDEGSSTAKGMALAQEVVYSVPVP